MLGLVLSEEETSLLVLHYTNLTMTVVLLCVLGANGFAPVALLNHTFIYLNVKNTTLSNGYLGSRNDEERSEMRYVMRIAEFSESSNL